LQETVREKDKIIDARTQAVALMSESLTRKNKEALTKLEDTRNELIVMQENFLRKQEGWDVERGQMLQDLDRQAERSVLTSRNGSYCGLCYLKSFKTFPKKPKIKDRSKMMKKISRIFFCFCNAI
jgi:hypothetical protein